MPQDRQVIPATRSSRNLLSVYPRRLRIDFGSQRSSMLGEMNGDINIEYDSRMVARLVTCETRTYIYNFTFVRCAAARLATCRGVKILPCLPQSS